MRDNQYQVDFYQRMRDGIRAWLEHKGKGFKYADYLLAAPDLFHLLCRLAVDPDVPAAQKAKLAAPIIYFIAPLDLIPEALHRPLWLRRRPGRGRPRPERPPSDARSTPRSSSAIGPAARIS